MSKYDPLLHYLVRNDSLHLQLSFREIERILGTSLPQSARRYRQWWENHAGHVQAASWLEAGYRTENCDFNSGTIWFRKTG